MKKPTLLVIVSFLFTHAGFSDTYVWEDYDDFSGSSLDSSKWGTKYLGGGIEPYVSGGKLILSATSGNPSATKVVKSGWENIFEGDDGGQAWVYPKDSDIVGIEAEFLIPSSTSSMSGLALGVASLYPLSYATAELNADPNSASQYSQGFGFYHLTNDGSEIENFGTTQRDTTHRLGATLIDGIIKLYVDGEIRYQGEAGTFNTDMFYINGFNDYQSQGLAFELTADKARVLRRVTTTNLDGSVLMLSSADDVSETLSFENGTFTSTFHDPTEGTFVDTDKSYILDAVSNDVWNITLEDGDTYSFDASTNSGTLVDYENGQIDTEGTWSFNFERHNSVALVSDPNGQAVVVQLGEEYKWNDSLDGVTLWSVSGSESEGDWYALTAKFSGGKLIYGFEFVDDVSDTGANTAPYEIDENGYIKSLEGDGDYQYYNVVSVEDGVIGTIQNDQGVKSVADNGVNQVDQWFFTTRADAEEFYYSKANPKSWMWFDAYPWVYSEEENDWLYFHPSGGSLMYWSNKGQAWRKFN